MKRKRASSGASNCPCDNIRTCSQWNENQDHLPRNENVYRLWRNQIRTWGILPVELESSAKFGCLTCSLILKAISIFDRNFENAPMVFLQLGRRAPQLRVAVQKSRSGGLWDFYLSHPHGYKGYEPFGPRVLQAPQQPRPTLLNFNLDAQIRTIEKWLQGCFDCHSICESGGFTPRRLLHVGSNHIDIAKDPIRLIEAHPDSSKPFIALSHCWGNIQHISSTKENYRQRLASIPMQDLSKTFQDAVWLTRRLGIKYLWIDSLCIIQDDIDDWKRQAATMHRLYAAAYLTIAASYGVDGSTGILYDAGISPFTVKVEMQGSDSQAATATVVLTPGAYLSTSNQVHRLYGSDEEIIKPSFSENGLLTRAWAFQERALSTRIIHYTNEELVWECKELRLCECGNINGNSFITSLVGSIKKINRTEEKDEESAIVSSKFDQDWRLRSAFGPRIERFTGKFDFDPKEI